METKQNISVKLQDLVRCNKLKEIEQFLKYNGNIDLISHNFENTALMIATYLGKIDMVKLLIKNGADINDKDVLKIKRDIINTQKNNKIR